MEPRGVMRLPARLPKSPRYRTRVGAHVSAVNSMILRQWLRAAPQPWGIVSGLAVCACEESGGRGRVRNAGCWRESTHEYSPHGAACMVLGKLRPLWLLAKPGLLSTKM